MTMTPDRQQRRARTLDDPLMEALRTPQRRRQLTWTLVGLMLLQGAIIVASPWLHIAVVLVGLIVLVMAAVLALGALKGATRGVEELSPAVLDERQVQVRGEVYVRAYKILGAVLATVLAVACIWSGAGWSAPPGSILLAAGVLLWNLIFFLPTIVTALTAEV